MHELETFLEENDFENYQILTNEILELYKNNKIGEIKSIVIENGPELIFEEVHRAFNDGKINTGSMESESITFAGYGEPLLSISKLSLLISKAVMLVSFKCLINLPLPHAGSKTLPPVNP